MGRKWSEGERRANISGGSGVESRPKWLSDGTGAYVTGMETNLGMDFARVFGRDLDALAGQIGSYPDDESVWRVGGTIKNPAATLALHATGNLEHFIGGALGGTGYVRDRDTEFSERGLPRAEILGRIVQCQERVLSTLTSLSDEEISAPYPGEEPPHLKGASTHFFLVYLASHLAWHLGQVDYHRRILVEETPGDG